MTSDDQQFLDVLASIPQDAANYAAAVADFIEQRTDHLASRIRGTLTGDLFSWMPVSMRPKASSNPFRRTPPPPRTLAGKACAWISENRTAVACTLAFAGTTIYLVHWRRKYRCRRRRAKRNTNGSKREVVILVASYHDPLCSSVALDLERRGYIVYVTVSNTSEEEAILSEKNMDLQPLWMDLTSSVPSLGTDIHPNFLPIQNLIRPRPTSSPSQNPYPFTLAGIVLLSSLSFPSGALATTPPSTLIDTTNTHFLSPILTLQQYLPLHQHFLLTQPNAPAPTIVLASPCIAASVPTSITPLETALPTALRSLLPGLRQSLPSSSIVDLRIGNIDISTAIPRTLRQHSPSSVSRGPAPQLTLPWHWHPSTHSSDLQFYFESASASHVRELHNAVFDALAPAHDLKLFGSHQWQIKARKENVMFVGSGARLYNMVGRLGLGLGWRWAFRKSTSDLETGTVARHQSPVSDENERQRTRHKDNVAGADESGLWEKV